MLREVALEHGVDEATFDEAMDLRKMAAGNAADGGLAPHRNFCAGPPFHPLDAPPHGRDPVRPDPRPHRRDGRRRHRGAPRRPRPAPRRTSSSSSPTTSRVDLVQLHAESCARLARDGMSFSQLLRRPTRCAAPRAPRSSPGSSRTTPGVFANAEPTGGYSAFMTHGDEDGAPSPPASSAAATDRHDGQVPRTATTRTDGYRTAGLQRLGRGRRRGYPEYHYTLTRTATDKYGDQPAGLPHRRPGPPRARRSSAPRPPPVLLEVANLRAARPYTPAPRDADASRACASPRRRPSRAA